MPRPAVTRVERRNTSAARRAAIRNPEFHAYLTPERIALVSSLAPLHDIGRSAFGSHPEQTWRLTPDELPRCENIRIR
jgi:hypothetical protein